MKIGIYARGLSGMGGVAKYIDAMCRALIDQRPAEHRLYIFHNLDGPLFGDDRPHVNEIRLAAKNRFYCDLVEAPAAINHHGLDVVWFTKYVVPFGLRAKTIATVHDMAYYMPELGAYTLADTLYMRVMIRNSCRRADHVVAVSHHTKQDIHRILGLADEKVSVIHEAADDRYTRVTDRRALEAWRRERGLEDPFVLFTGGISPRKNLHRLIRAYASAMNRIPHKLVLTGGKGWKNRAVLDAIARNPNIIKLGFVPDEEMPYLYSAADLFVYPSLYEGFGLPILEAAQCGCPVLAARTSSLVEVGGDGVQFIDPMDTEGMSRAIVTTLGNEVMRASLRKQGAANAKRFSWQAAARALYRRIDQLASDVVYREGTRGGAREQ